MGKLGAETLALAALAAVSVATAGESGCSATRPTELVPGISSQVVVPHDLQAVRVTVVANGRSVFDVGYDVGPNGNVQLPSTLGVVSGGTSTVVTITVRGYETTCEQSEECAGLGDNGVGAKGARILRRSIQSFVNGRTLFVPMPLTYSCWNNDCGDSSMACKGNTCVSAATAETALVDFDPSLLDGTDICFSAKQCFGDDPDAGKSLAVAPDLIDPTTCTYAFPFPSVPGVTAGQINVRAYYQNFTWQMVGGAYQPVLKTGGEQEILNEDPVEGFTVVNPATLPDAGGAASRTLFKLAPGLCQLVQAASKPPPSPAAGGAPGYITISDLRVSNLCPPKPPLLPICAGDQTNALGSPNPGQVSTDGMCNVGVALAPTPSALYLVMDHSAVMHGAFGPMGAATTLSLSLNDPVFKRTFAAFKFLPGNPADCAGGTAFSMPDIDFALAGDAQSQIASKLEGWTPTEVGAGTCTTSADCSGAAPICTNGACVAPLPLELQAAANLNSGAYAHLSTFLTGKEQPNIAATMFFVNRLPDATNDCPTAGGQSVLTSLENEIAAAYSAQPSLQTYFVVLGHDASDTSPQATEALAFYKQIQTDLPQAVQVLDATQTSTMQAAQSAAANFAKVVTQLGTCLYDSNLAPGTDPSKVQVAYTGLAGEKVVPLAPACTGAAQDGVDGWNFDGGRIRICGKSCGDLRQAILASSAASLQTGLPAQDVPVTAQLLCSGTTSINDAGPVFDATVGAPDAAASDDSSATGTTDATATADAATDDAGTIADAGIADGPIDASGVVIGTVGDP